PTPTIVKVVFQGSFPASQLRYGSCADADFPSGHWSSTRQIGPAEVDIAQLAIRPALNFKCCWTFQCEATRRQPGGTSKRQTPSWARTAVGPPGFPASALPFAHQVSSS